MYPDHSIERWVGGISSSTDFLIYFTNQFQKRFHLKSSFIQQKLFTDRFAKVGVTLWLNNTPPFPLGMPLMIGILIV